MSRFKILDHTADLGISATGDDFAEALSWAAIAMFSIITNLDSVAALDSSDLTVKSDSPEALVVDWLNELLYRFEAEGFLPKEFSVSVDENGVELRAQCVGESVDQDRHRIWPGVKAATYHGLEVSHNGEWQIKVVLDI